MRFRFVKFYVDRYESKEYTIGLTCVIDGDNRYIGFTFGIWFYGLGRTCY